MKIRAPGRICLFGEHQDYLGYPVIAAAIDKYIFIDAHPTQDSATPCFHINMPDLPEKPIIDLFSPSTNQLLSYESKRDYLRSGLNVAWKNGARWARNWDITITGNIPINAGASSSSAMVIAWLAFLFAASKKEITPSERAVFGYQTEVAEFNEAGGQMDHFASSVGNLIYIESKPAFKATSLPGKLSGFVLGNSAVKKNTVDDLKRVKNLALSSFDHLKETMPNFDRFTTPISQVQPYIKCLSESEQKIAIGNLTNRDITQKAKSMLSDNSLQSQQEFGKLLINHHQMLSNNVGVSHPVVDQMVNIVMKAGALGAKINGSGFGGTMFAYAPTKQQAVINALHDEGFDCWPLEISNGAEVIQK